MAHQSNHKLKITWERGQRSRAALSPAAELPGDKENGKLHAVSLRKENKERAAISTKRHLRTKK